MRVAFGMLAVLGQVAPLAGGDILDVVADIGISAAFLWFLDRHDKRINETLRVMNERTLEAAEANASS